MAALLEARDLRLHYGTPHGPVRALDGGSFTIAGKGEAVGIVGESGSGKTSLAIALMRLPPPNTTHFSGQVLLDVGANVGIFTTEAAKRGGESGRVVAIEPHPDNFRLLAENVERNGLGNVSLVQAALDERSGSAELFVHERGINHSLKRRTGRSVPVALKTIDQVAREQALDRVDLIKIDTEGNVPAILRGARETIGRYRPRIVFERDSPEESRGLRELFEEFGYDTQDIRCFTYACPKA